MWVRLVAVAATVAGASACIIGPKQDDPETLIDPKNNADSGTFGADASADTWRVTEDVGTIQPFLDSGAAADSGAPTDAGAPESDAGCLTDAASDSGDALPCDGGSDALASD